jgi:hypothetical protein
MFKLLKSCLLLIKSTVTISSAIKVPFTTIGEQGRTLNLLCQSISKLSKAARVFCIVPGTGNQANQPGNFVLRIDNNKKSPKTGDSPVRSLRLTSTPSTIQLNSCRHPHHQRVVSLITRRSLHITGYTRPDHKGTILVDCIRYRRVKGKGTHVKLDALRNDLALQLLLHRLIESREYTFSSRSANKQILKDT